MNIKKSVPSDMPLFTGQPVKGDIAGTLFYEID